MWQVAEYTVLMIVNKRQCEGQPSLPYIMAGVTAYFDLDGTLLDASSEKPSRNACSTPPVANSSGTTMWSLGFIGNLLRGRSIYDAARNRGHLALCNWETLRKYSAEIVETKLSKRVRMRHFRD